MALRDKAIAGFSWNFIQQLGNGGVQFIVQIILSRILSPEEFGLYGVIYFFYIISNVISDSGLGQSIVRSDKLDEKDFGTIFITNFIISVLLYALIMLFSPLIADFYEEPLITKLLAVLCLSIILTSFSTIQMYKLTRELNFKRQALIQIPSVLIAGVVGVSLAYTGYGIWALVYMTLVRELCLSIQYWLFTGWRPKLIFSKEKFKHHFNFGYKLSISTLLDNFTSSFLPLIIGIYHSKALVGYFTRANDLVNFPKSTLTTVLGKVSYPVLSQVKDDSKRIKSTFRKILSIALYIMGGMMFLFVVVAKPMILLLLGEKWLPIVPYFQLLCLSGIFYPINIYNQNLLKVFGKSNELLKANLVTKFVFLIGAFLVVKQGVIPLIIFIISIELFTFYVNVFFSSKYIDLSFEDQVLGILYSLWPSIISCILVYFIEKYLNYNLYVEFIILFGSFIFWFIVISEITKNTSYIELKKMITSKLKSIN